MAYRISDDCISCSVCEAECPQGAISQGPNHYSINARKCSDCGTCASVCPVEACKPA
ncbi:MAG: 4Fe-4S binding protein [Chloroflexi bacterium]|nr:4Fe-4S binding protein [Chloroflexota bacterium]